MSATSNLLLLAGVVCVVGGAVALKAKLAGLAGSASDAKSRFKQKALLTQNELEFLGRLETAVPELRILAQVSMGALLDPAVSRSDGKAYFRARGMFSQKIVDFVAQSRVDGSVVAIIELDDRTHDSGKDAKRDEMLSGVGYRVVRWQSKVKPDAIAIRAQLFPVSNPVAPGATPPGATVPDLPAAASSRGSRTARPPGA